VLEYLVGQRARHDRHALPPRHDHDGRARGLGPLPRIRLGGDAGWTDSRGSGREPHARYRAPGRGQALRLDGRPDRVLRRERRAGRNCRRVVDDEPLRELLQGAGHRGEPQALPVTDGPKTLDQFDIRGRSALVTGAASGIGLAYAECMAEAGARVTLSDIDAEGAAREAQRLSDEGYEVRWTICDVSDLAQVARAFDDHVRAYGGCDIAFANAGLDVGNGFWTPEGTR